MRIKASLLVPTLLLTLAGCSSTETLQAPVQTVTATVQGDATSIFWLEERQRFPETLTERVMMGDYGQYASEYRWRKGVVREIRREGKALIDGQLKQQSIVIRYDSEGEAVYQQYRLDGALLPIRGTELVRYYQQAEKALETAQKLAKDNQYFFQGYWNEGEFEECGSGDEKTLKFETKLPDYIVQRLSQEDNFLAAAGKIGSKVNTVEVIIALEQDSADCFTRPIFDN